MLYYLGRGDDAQKINLQELLIPKLYLLHKPFTMGLTGISLVALVYISVSKNKANKFFGIILILVSTIPIFSYVLNGFLYAGGKTLIPFVPVVLICTAELIKTILDKNNKVFKVGLISYILISSLIFVVMYNGVEMYIKKEDLKNDFYANYNKHSVIEDKENLYRTNSQVNMGFINRIGNMRELKTSVYSSLFSQEYYDAYNKLFINPVKMAHRYEFYSSNNLIFQMFMGEKYLYTYEEYGNPYEKINEIGDIKVYKNDYVLPIGYATTKKVNRKDFEKMQYPDNVINLLGSVISEEDTNKKIINMRDLKANLNEFSINNIQNAVFSIDKDTITIDSLDEGEIDLSLNRNISDNQLIYIGFDIEEQADDLTIQINDVKNTLASKRYVYKNEHTHFTYFVFGNNYNIKLTKGKFVISNIKYGAINLDDLKNIKRTVDSFVIDQNKTRGDVIRGSIDVKNDDSYFVLSIPYDEGFSIKVDGIKTEYEKANEYFIGFSLLKGMHDIEITYRAPGKILGVTLSILAISTCIALTIYENKEKKIEG